ncbi:MAG: polysaccharide pyruvyl transferase CsaB [Endomicrobiia bacterium]
MGQKRIVIAGYFGFKNAGDELILESIIDSLRKEIIDIHIDVLSNAPSETILNYKVNAVNRWNPFEIIKTIKNSDLLIMAGGLFQDITGIFSLYYYLAIIILGKIFGKSIFLYGVEFAPIRYKFNCYILKKVLKFANKIAVRSTGSLEFLKNLGIQKNVILSADIVISYPVVYLKQRPKERKLKKIGLILKNSPKNFGIFIEICESLFSNLNADLFFIPFHLDRDLNFSLQISKALDFPTRIICWNRANELFYIISKMDFVMTQRLHGLILSTLLRIPVLGISSDPKLQFFFDEFGQKLFSNGNLSADLIVNTISDIWKWQDEFKKNIENNLPQLQYRALLNTLHAVKLLHFT